MADFIVVFLLGFGGFLLMLLVLALLIKISGKIEEKFKITDMEQMAIFMLASVAIMIIIILGENIAHYLGW